MFSRSLLAAGPDTFHSPFPAHASFADRLALAMLALGLGTYFVVRGSLNAAIVMAALVGLVQLIRHRDAARAVLSQPAARWILAALLAPILVVALVELAHGELVPRYFDAPLRFALAGIVMLHLAARRLDFARLAAWAAPLAVLLVTAYLYLLPIAPAYFWGGRFATYFIDPLFLSQHVMIAGFLCLFSAELDAGRPLAGRLLRYAALPAAVAVALGTQSRTGWVMVPVLACVWLGGIRHRGSRRGVVVSLVLVAAGCVAAYYVSSIVQDRIDGAVADVTQYLHGGDRDTSIGIRLSLYRANWLLFLQQPLVGWGFSSIPDVKAIDGIRLFYTPVFEHYFIMAGGHNEFLQAMMRMGTAGLLSRLLLLFIPLALFAAATRSTDRVLRTNGFLGLAVVVGYITASFTTEVFNLIHAASFYALLVAVFAAGALRREPA